jgi:ferredoxin
VSGSGTVSVAVRRDRCIGAGQCARTAPEIFSQDDHDGLVRLLDASPPAESVGAARTAARVCPVQAIAVREAGGT